MANHNPMVKMLDNVDKERLAELDNIMGIEKGTMINININNIKN